MNRAELKSKAKQQLRGKYGILFVVTLIIAVISGVASSLLVFVPFGGWVVTIVITPAFSLSVVSIYLSITEGFSPDVSDAFGGFSNFWGAFKVSFLVGLFTYLWSLLFIIPGIVKAFSYSMSMFVLADNEGKGARECIKESMAMTNGHKWELFVLGLSFVGWVLLGILSFFIGFIWIIPYMNATYANAYQSLKPKKPEEPEETEELDSAAEGFLEVQNEE